MRTTDDPLALEPLGPMGPLTDAPPMPDPLALEPLSPVETDSEETSER